MSEEMRYCWNCGDEIGVIPYRYYDRSDTCGKQACLREARNQAAYERDEAHAALDSSMGWDRL